MTDRYWYALLHAIVETVADTITPEEAADLRAKLAAAIASEDAELMSQVREIVDSLRAGVQQ